MHGLSWRGSAAVAALAAVLLAVFSATAATAATGCRYEPDLRRWVCHAASSPSQLPNSAAKLSTYPGLCSWQGRAYACHSDQLGWFDNRDGCYYVLMTPQPAYDSTLWEG